MSLSNRITASITDDQKNEAIALVKQAMEKLPFLITVEGKEKKKLVKFGPDSVSFVEDALRGVNEFPSAFPASFDKEEFIRDATLVIALRDVFVSVGSLYTAINDTLSVTGADAMSAANDAYSYLKKAASNNVAAKDLVDRMSLRYKGQGRKKTTEPPAP
ncbi:MAG: hypothetical protein HYZ34_09375 [Ignavibacteriae bacterium]|nr:hypothetical protein [Ignavibacteriota bacterium]